MTRIKVFVVFALAVTAGGAFAFATYNYVQKIPARTVAIPTRPVVIAATNLDVGDEIDSNDVRTIEWPASAVPEGAIGTPDEIVGRGVVVPVVQNEPILEAKLASKEAGSGLPPAIPPGLRAVSVRVNEVIGVAGYVLPGTRVDVVATVSPTQQPSDMTSKVILTNVEVLTAGTKMERDTDKDKPMPVSVVTLLVGPEEAERLTLAATEGKIQLALRNPLDKATPATRGVRPAVLLGLNASTPRPAVRVASAAARPAPAPAPVAVQQYPEVEVIRGDKRAREVVRQE